MCVLTIVVHTTALNSIGMRANFFWGGAEPSLPEKFPDSAGKKCYANLQNYFARLTLPSNY